MADETEETPKEQEAPAPKKSPLLLIGGLGGGVLLGTIGGLFVLGPHFAPSHAAPKVAAAADSTAHKSTDAEAVYQVDNLVLNPAGSNGTRFLLMSVALSVKDEATATAMKARDAEIRDAILRLAGDKTAEELSQPSSRDLLRTQLTTLLNTLFPAGTVQKVFFPQFVIQ